jgi:hypothetical protein
MADYSLVPVDYKPDFDDYSLVPVNYNPFSNSERIIQQAPTQLAQTQIQPTHVQFAQSQPQSPPQQPATGANQPGANGPATGDGPAESSGGARGGNAGSDPSNPPSDQGAAEPPPFAGYANPTPAESLVNKAKMYDLAAEIDADRTGTRGSDFEAGKSKSYRFVTTKPALEAHQIRDVGITFMAISPFHAHDGARTAIIDASPEHPLRVTVTDDGKLTISPP